MSKNEVKQEVSAEEMFGEDKNEMVTVAGDNGGVAIFNPSEMRFYSSIPNETIQQKAKIMKALGNSDYTLKQVSEKKIMLVTDIIAHGVTLTKEDGELEDSDRIVMVMADGQTVSGCSRGFKSSITNLMSIFGKPPYSPALPIKVMDVTTRKGMNTFNLAIAEDSDPLPRIGAIKK